jgi:hypothetical protein
MEEMEMTMAEKKSLLEALDLDKAGDWDGAHAIVQKIDSKDAARVHAYLHRVEGDLGNADYWYRRAGVESNTCSLKDEWNMLHKEFSEE